MVTDGSDNAVAHRQAIQTFLATESMEDEGPNPDFVTLVLGNICLGLSELQSTPQLPRDPDISV